MSIILKNHEAKRVYWSEIDLLDEHYTITEQSFSEMWIYIINTIVSIQLGWRESV